MNLLHEHYTAVAAAMVNGGVIMTGGLIVFNEIDDSSKLEIMV